MPRLLTVLAPQLWWLGPTFGWVGLVALMASIWAAHEGPEGSGSALSIGGLILVAIAIGLSSLEERWKNSTER